jgi:hypothetical protein
MHNERSARPGAWQRGRAVAVEQRDGCSSSKAYHEVLETVYNATGRACGAIVCDADGSIWLEKRGLDPRVHRLRQPPAWATDSEHLDRLEERGGHGVRLITATGETWTATLKAFRQHGVEFDRGFGWQVALPLRFWRVESDDTPRQLDLFSAEAAG